MTLPTPTQVRTLFLTGFPCPALVDDESCTGKLVASRSQMMCDQCYTEYDINLAMIQCQSNTTRPVFSPEIELLPVITYE